MSITTRLDRILLAAGLCLLVGAARSQPARAAQPGLSAADLEVRWTAQVGRTTFRTTMLRHADLIVIGTHGDSLDGQDEKSDGVYLLDARTGKQRGFIPTPGQGDLDVGGVAFDGERLIFSTDNGQVVAASLDGKVAWTTRLSGKVRPAPALGDLNGDGVLDAVVGDERGMLWALSGVDGVPLWALPTGANDYGARGFIAAAAVGDLDGDGQLEVVAGARDGVLRARAGKDGRLLWERRNSSGIHASPSLVDFDGDGFSEILAAWSYGEVEILDAAGRVLWSQTPRRDGGGIEGLFSSPVTLDGEPGRLVVGSSWWGKPDGVIGLAEHRRAFKSTRGRVSASAVVVKTIGANSPQAVLGTEAGELLTVDRYGRATVLARLGGAIEASAFLDDVDSDGKPEILVASNDGKLTCFSSGRAARILVSRFRGASTNAGQLPRPNFRWRWSEPPRRLADDRDQPPAPPGHLGETPPDQEPEPENSIADDVAEYFAMPETVGGGYVIAAGVSPEDAPGYKFLSAINFLYLPDGRDVIDVGFHGEAFSYRQTPRGTNWSILAMGPLLRIGRLFINVDINLISFRHISEDHKKGWLPGIGGRLFLPLVNHGRDSIWTVFMPTPVAGFEVFFDNELEYDQTGFWVGLAWIGFLGAD